MGGQAYDGPRGQVFMVFPEELTVVGVDTDDGAGHPLWQADVKDPLEEETVLSIMDVGLLQAPAVRKNGKDAKGKDVMEVVYGRRRTLHAREANRRLVQAGKDPMRIPVQFLRGEDLLMMKKAVAENAIRKTMRPMSLAREAGRLRQMGQSDKELAVTFGVNVTTIARYLKLLDLDPKVAEAVDAGAIGFQAAAELARLGRPTQVATLKQMLAENATSREAATRAAKSAEGDAAPAAASNGHAGSNGESKPKAPPPPYKLPTKSVLRKMLDLHKADELPKDLRLNDQAVELLRWISGDLSPSRIKGLLATLHKIEPAKKPAKGDDAEGAEA